MSSPGVDVHTTARWTVLRVFLAAFAVFLGLGTAWAFSSPLESIPDEPPHTIHAAAVVRGQLTGERGEHVGWTLVDVPKWAADTPGQLCWAFKPEKSAACSPQFTTSDRPQEAQTTAGTYDPLYYFVTGLPSLFMSGAPALYAMRMMSVLLSAALLAGATVGLWRMRSRSFALLALAVGTTPMVMYLAGSVNPNSAEIAAGVMTFAWLANLTERGAADGVRAHQVAMVAVPAVVLANTRSIAMVWLLAFIVATLADRDVIRRVAKSRAFWVGVVVIGVGVLAAVLWTLRTSSLAVTTPVPGVGQSFPRAFVSMMFLTVEWWGDYVGLFGLLDTPVPATTARIWGALFFALIVAGIVFGRGRTRRVAVVMTLALVLLPAIIQGQATHDYGYIWQGRYNLALLCTTLLAAGIALDTAFPRAFTLPRMQGLAGFVLVAILLMQVHTSVWVARRWVVGTDDSWTKMLRSPEWQPPGTWELWTVVTALAVLAGGWLVLRTIHRDAAVLRSTGSAPDRVDASTADATGRSGPRDLPTAAS